MPYYGSSTIFRDLLVYSSLSHIKVLSCRRRASHLLAESLTFLADNADCPPVDSLA